MTVHKKLGRLDIQLFGNILADLDQVSAALTTGAGFRFVAVLDARQMSRKRLASRTQAFGFDDSRAGLVIGELFDFGFESGQIGVPGFLEHITLQRRQSFAFDTVADSLDMRQLQGQGLDFQVFGPDGFSIPLRLLEQCLHDGRHLRLGGGIEVQVSEFGERIHEPHYTLNSRCQSTPAISHCHCA
jgi:hypothetical protein